MSPAALITQLYIGYFDRAPDPAGLAYWTDLVAQGQSIPAIAGYFAQQPEFKAIYGDPGLGTFEPMNFVIKVYQNLFDRMPEPEGLAYWTAQLTSGAVAPGQLVATVQYVANSAGSGVDFQALANKVEAATYFLDQMAAAKLGWSLDPARNLIDKVGPSETSLAEAKAAIKAYIDHVLHPDTGPGNSAPVAVNDTARTDPNHSILIDVLANDIDADHDTLAIVANSVTATHGTAVIEAGKIRFTPEANYHGTASITYKARDDSAQSNAATVSVSVNTLPVAVDDTQLAMAPTGSTGFVINPVNGHFYKYFWAASSSYSWYTDLDYYLHAAAMSGGYLATITSAQENAFVTALLPSGAKAWIGARDDATEGVWRLDVGADGEQGAIIWQNSQTETGRYTNWASGQPTNSNPSKSFAYLSTDGTWADQNRTNSGYIVKGYLAEIGGRPQDHIKTEQASALSFLAEPLLANDTDADGDTLTVTAVGGTSLKGAAVTLVNGVITYDATAAPDLMLMPRGDIAIDTFTYTISDGYGGTATATATITVVGSNHASVIGGSDSGVVEVGAAAGATPSTTASGQLTIADIDPGDMVFQANTIQGKYGQLTIDNAGAWTYTLDSGDRGLAVGQGQPETDNIIVLAADGTTHVIGIGVIGQNDTPVAVEDVLAGARLMPTEFARYEANGHYYKFFGGRVEANYASTAASLTGGYLATIVTAGEGGFLASLLPANEIAWFSASDAAQEGRWIITDGPEAGLQFWQGLTAEQGGYSTNGAFANWRSGEPNNSSNDDFAYIQFNSQWADFYSYYNYDTMFGYMVEYGGRTGDALKQSNAAILSITTATLLLNDRDVDAGDTLSVTAVSATSTNGAAVSLANGIITYNPTQAATLQNLAAGGTLTDTFTYTLSDNHGATSQATVTFTVVGGAAPSMTGAVGLTVAENISNVKVGSFTLADTDSANGLQIQVLSQIANGAMVDSRFEVRPANGTTGGTPGTYEVWLKNGASLDYEVASQVNLTIEAFDPTGLVGSAALTVTVTDVVEP